MPAQLVAESVAALAANTALHLAKRSKTDLELRAALQTSKLDSNSVRIGQYDIRRHDETGVSLFSIHKALGGDLILAGFAFYETARAIVALLNDDISPATFNVQRFVRANEQYIRLRSDVLTYMDQIDYYEGKGDFSRANSINHRLGDAQARAELIRLQLLPRTA